MTAWLHLVTAALWVGWLIYWGIAATRTKPMEREESPASRLVYGVPLWIAGWQMVGWRLPLAFLHGRFVPDGRGTEVGGLVVATAGLAFAVRARVHLGANWSASVAVKQDHTLIRSSPYGYVRHPIYTGLLLAILGTAIAFGEWRDLVALALAVASCVYKLRMEERWMAETFGPAYIEYRAKVAGLIPFLL